MKAGKHEKVENNGIVAYVGSSVAVYNPLFFVHKL